MVAVVECAVKDCTKFFEQSLGVVTRLQEDPMVQQLETEARELQQCYDEVKVTAHIVAITQRLANLQKAKALKEKVDAAQHKEFVVKACLKPWLDKAYLIIATIEGNLASLQGTQ